MAVDQIADFVVGEFLRVELDFDPGMRGVGMDFKQAFRRSQGRVIRGRFLAHGLERGFEDLYYVWQGLHGIYIGNPRIDFSGRWVAIC